MDDVKYVESARLTDLPDYAPMQERLQNVQTLQLLHAVMGMVTEAGELMDAIKRHVVYGKPIDLVNLSEECGDSFWYQALLARTAGFTFAEAKSLNIAKLATRYPEKFTEDAALNRDLEKERRVLEGGTK